MVALKKLNVHNAQEGLKKLRILNIEIKGISHSCLGKEIGKLENLLELDVNNSDVEDVKKRRKTEKCHVEVHYTGYQSVLKSVL